MSSKPCSDMYIGKVDQLVSVIECGLITGDMLLFELVKIAEKGLTYNQFSMLTEATANAINRLEDNQPNV